MTMDGRSMDRCTGGMEWINGCMGEYVDKWMDGYMDGWIDGWDRALRNITR
jgi:hypothetical protein